MTECKFCGSEMYWPMGSPWKRCDTCGSKFNPGRGKWIDRS